ncbi:MAG: D-alanyl-D-alanine carboxypeptidase family protein [Oscillospiraceae bacterium]
MKKTLSFLAVFALFINIAITAFALSEALPQVTAQSFAVIDAATGQLLVQKGGSDAHYPASITKILTMALAMEKCGGDMSAQVTVTPEDIQIERGSSHVALQAGEVISLQDAFNATMLQSANDAANVLATYVSGSHAAFSDAMNAKLSALGITNTHFVNAHGLYNAQHYTTAEDMAKITGYALTVPGFKELFGAISYEMLPTNKQSEKRLFGTDNSMLAEGNKYSYKGVIGGKSGWTQESGYTMVEAVERGGHTLIAVVMASAQKYDKFKDCAALFDYCFRNFTDVTISGNTFDGVKVPVYGGSDKMLGKVNISVPDFTVLLPVGYTKDNLKVDYNVPEKYVIGKPFAASFNVSLKEEDGVMGSSLASYPMQTGSLGEILARNTGVAAGFKTKYSSDFPWQTVLTVIGGAFLVLLALFFGRISYVAYVKAQRKKKKIEHLRKLYGANAPNMMPQAYAAQKPRRAEYSAAMQRGNAPVQSNLRIVLGGAQYERKEAVDR